jgi:hypothetical protein
MAIGFSSWETFASWEWDTKIRVGYLSGEELDRNWVLEANEPVFLEPSDNDGSNDEVIREVKPKYVPGEVADKVVRRKVVHDDTDYYVGRTTYHVQQALAWGEHFKMPPTTLRNRTSRSASFLARRRSGVGTPGSSMPCYSPCRSSIGRQCMGFICLYRRCQSCVVLGVARNGTPGLHHQPSPA